MLQFKDFLEESNKYVCKCLKRFATINNYNEMRKRYPDLSKEEFFTKFKEYIREKTHTNTCMNHCENIDNKHKYSVYFKDLD